MQREEAQEWVLPRQHSVLIPPSGRNKSKEFSGPHPTTQPLLTGFRSADASGHRGYLAGLHVCVEGQKSCYLQIVWVAGVMSMMMMVMMIMIMMLLVECSMTF